MRLGSSGLAIFAVASALLHWAFWVRMPDARDLLSKARPMATVEFTVLPPSQAPPSAAVPPADSQPSAPPIAAAPPARAPRRTPAQQPTAAAAPSSIVAVEAPSAPAEEPTLSGPSTGVAVPAAPRHPAAIDISPRSAANTLANSLGPKLCNPQSSVPAEACETRDARPSAQEELTRSLQQAAHSVAHLAKREAPQLQHEADGGYSYRGSVFSARIGLDGQVAFDDKPGVHIGPGGASLGFDLSDAVDSLTKHELYSAEKRWFLDQTIAVRGQLADAFRAVELMRAKRSLEQALERIVASANSAPHKHDAVFALWQDCGDDADAANVRRVVEVFVRKRMPEGSNLGFDAAELERLNAARSGMRPFDPYRKADAGAPG
jgi:hypothetical protein